MRIVRQDGTPVNEPPEENVDDSFPRPEDEDIRAMARDLHQGFLRFKNSVLFKVGVIAVVIKTIDVAGKIIVENQRLKAGLRDDEKEDEE